MYLFLQPIDPTTPKGIDQLIEELIIQQYETDLFLWQQIETFEEDQAFMESVDAYPLCNWRIIYSLLGIVEPHDDLKIFHAHIPRRLFHGDLITSPFIAYYTDMILDSEDYDNQTKDLRTDIQHLITIIKNYQIS